MSDSKPSRITIELLERAMAGEFVAGQECYAILQPILRYRIVRVLIPAGCCSPEIVNDLSHDTFVALLEHDGRLIRAWDPQRGSFETYAGLVARQCAKDYTQKKKEGLLGDEQNEQHEQKGQNELTVESSRWPERIVASTEIRKKAFVVLWDELSDLGRKLFELLFIEQCEIEEVCVLMNMEKPAVYAWRSRLRRRLEEIAVEMGGV